MEKDVTLNPIDVSLLGAEGIVFQAHRIANLIEELSRLRGGVHFIVSNKTTHETTTMWCFEFYSKMGGNFATEIGSTFTT
jgi:hypothetical protein